MGDVSLAIAFGAGLLSFFSPCVLPLVPVYLASLTGPDVLEARSVRFRLPIFLHSLAFVAGFSVVFSLWGAGAGMLGGALAGYSTLVRQVAGVLLILLGLFMLLSLRVPWLNLARRANLSAGSGAGYWRSLLTGGIFCLAWTPCLGATIAGILSLAGASGTALRGTYLLAVYSLGLGVPFLITGAAFDAVWPLLRRVNRYGTAIYIVSGLLLIAVGLLVLADKLAFYII